LLAPVLIALFPEIAMPLPTDEKLLSLSQKILDQFDAIFGLHPGFRPAHAKGFILSGTFTPSGQAASLTRAPHVQRPSTPRRLEFFIVLQLDTRYSPKTSTRAAEEANSALEKGQNQ
jgi:hypothetical protein